MPDKWKMKRAMRDKADLEMAQSKKTSRTVPVGSAAHTAQSRHDGGRSGIQGLDNLPRARSLRHDMGKIKSKQKKDF